MKSHPDGTHYDARMIAIQRGVESGLGAYIHPVRASARKVLNGNPGTAEIRPAKVSFWTSRRLEGVVIIVAAFAFVLGLDLTIPTVDDLAAGLGR